MNQSEKAEEEEKTNWIYLYGILVSRFKLENSDRRHSYTSTEKGLSAPFTPCMALTSEPKTPYDTQRTQNRP